MVRATDHVKHVTVDQSSQAKRLQINLKIVKAVVKVVERARVVVEKALKEANACIATIEAKLGIFFY